MDDQALGLVLTALGVVATVVMGAPAFLPLFRRGKRRSNITPAENFIADKTEIVADKTWRCGVYDYPPLSSIDVGDNVPPAGPLIDLAAAVFGQIGVRIEFFHFSYEDFYDGSELPDVVLGMFDTPKRSKLMNFSRPIYEIGLQGLCRITQSGDLLEAIHEGKLKLAVYHGEVGWEFALDELPDAKRLHHIVVVGGGHQMDTTDYLKIGKYDIVLMDELSCVNFLRQNGNSHDFKLAFQSPISKYRTTFAVNKRHADRLDAINVAIELERNRPHFIANEKRLVESYKQVIQLRGLRNNNQ